MEPLPRYILAPYEPPKPAPPDRRAEVVAWFRGLLIGSVLGAILTSLLGAL